MRSSKNIRAQIDLVTADWAYASFAPDDLSFTLPSTYQIGDERVQQRDASSDSSTTNKLSTTSHGRIRAFPTWKSGTNGPTAHEATEFNYIHDGVHPTPEGAMLYGNLFMDELLEAEHDPGDFDHNRRINEVDLDILVAYWKPCGHRRTAVCAGTSMAMIMSVSMIYVSYSTTSPKRRRKRVPADFRRRRIRRRRRHGTSFWQTGIGTSTPATRHTVTWTLMVLWACTTCPACYLSGNTSPPPETVHRRPSRRWTWTAMARSVWRILICCWPTGLMPRWALRL